MRASSSPRAATAASADTSLEAGLLSAAGNARVRVVARFRPPVTAEERMAAATSAVVPSQHSGGGAEVVVHGKKDRYRFELDGALAEGASQEDVYKEVGRPIVEAVLQGYNGTIFTYGQTGSGKSYCLFGPGFEYPELHGIAPRAAAELLGRLGGAGSAAASAEGCVLRCSFFEIYQEKMRDLLGTAGRTLRVREDPRDGPVVEGLAATRVTKVSEVMRALKMGNSRRKVGSTCMNDRSSRSHGIFVMRWEEPAGAGPGQEGLALSGRLTLVDLAGSERVSKSRSVGETLEEAKKINTSLTALGKVVDALASGRSHVPYRDSMLTRVLEESLGGNCRTTILVAASASAQHREETLSALRFGTRARKVQTCPRVNLDYSPDQLLPLVCRLRRELTSARREIVLLQHRGKNVNVECEQQGEPESWPLGASCSLSSLLEEEELGQFTIRSRRCSDVSDGNLVGCGSGTCSTRSPRSSYSSTLSASMRKAANGESTGSMGSSASLGALPTVQSRMPGLPVLLGAPPESKPPIEGMMDAATAKAAQAMAETGPEDGADATELLMETLKEALRAQERVMDEARLLAAEMGMPLSAGFDESPYSSGGLASKEQEEARPVSYTPCDRAPSTEERSMTRATGGPARYVIALH